MGRKTQPGRQIRRRAMESLTESAARGRYRGVALAEWCSGLLLPRRCETCLSVHDGGFCHSCHELLPWIGIGCEHCRVPLASPGTCPRCQRQPPRWDDMVVPFDYAEPVSHMLRQLKYHSRLHVVPALSEALAEQVLRRSGSMPQALLPIPLHASRLRWRGFNQATLLARETGRLLGIPVDTRLLLRTRATPTQTRLAERMRKKNLRHAFAVKASGRYDAVAVIDDVITTGATMDSACRVLRQYGYSRISAWAVARA